MVGLSSGGKGPRGADGLPDEILHLVDANARARVRGLRAQLAEMEQGADQELLKIVVEQAGQALALALLRARAIPTRGREVDRPALSQRGPLRDARLQVSLSARSASRSFLRSVMSSMARRMRCRRSPQYCGRSGAASCARFRGKSCSTSKSLERRHVLGCISSSNSCRRGMSHCRSPKVVHALPHRVARAATRNIS